MMNEEGFARREKLAINDSNIDNKLKLGKKLLFRESVILERKLDHKTVTEFGPRQPLFEIIKRIF